MADKPPRYQQRQKFHAHKLVRLLFKSCAAQEVSSDAMLLVIHVSHTEDAARYQGPVRFWNSQLNETLGFKHPRKIGAARESAVGAGWLHYHRDHDRAVGKYWTLLPPHVAKFDDAPIEDSYSESGTQTDGSCSDNGIRSGTRSGIGSGTRSGTPSNPSPKPKPNSEPSDSRPAPLASEFEFRIKSAKGESWTLSKPKLAEYVSTFGDSKWVEGELRKARQWCSDNAAKRKTPSGMERFLTGWLSRANDRGHLRPTVLTPAIKFDKRDSL